MNKLLSIENILINVNIENKIEVLKYIAKLAVDMNISKSEEYVFKSLLKREEEFSTNLGENIALPHIKSKYVSKPTIIILVLNKDIYWDNGDVRLIISFLMPETIDRDVHLKVISNLSRKLIDNDFKQALIKNKDREEIFNLINSAIYRESD